MWLGGWGFDREEGEGKWIVQVVNGEERVQQIDFRDGCRITGGKCRMRNSKMAGSLRKTNRVIAWMLMTELGG